MWRLLLLFLALVPFLLAQQESESEQDTCAEVGDCKANFSEPPEQKEDLTYIREKKPFRFDEFIVAGVNLASYDPAQPVEAYSGDEPPFELFYDFNIRDWIQGTANENWWEFRRYKSYSSYVHPSLAFYFDKVASKRWLMKIGIPIPGVFALNYTSELTSSTDLDEVTRVIQNLLPENKDYCVKPNNNIRSQGVWLVSHDPDTGKTRISVEASPLMETDEFAPENVAASIANQLMTPLQEWVPRMCDFIPQGIVVEERFTAFDHDFQPALEFKVFTIWGKVFLANQVRGQWIDWYTPGQVLRNGTMTEGSAQEKLPEWIDWNRVVEIAEKLGANKDLFRTDIFVGVPAGSPALRPDATEEERLAAVQYVVSETQPTSSENIPDKMLNEALRLWIAGYKIGNYRLVSNTEVPPDYKPNVKYP